MRTLPLTDSIRSIGGALVALSSLAFLAVFFVLRNQPYAISDLVSDVLFSIIHVRCDCLTVINKKHLTPQSKHICAGGILFTSPMIVGVSYRRVPIAGPTDKETSLNSLKAQRETKNKESGMVAFIASGQV